jgi:alpha-beta hydrolase superfamily lysophospholipase
VRRVELRIDVGRVSGLGGSLQTAALVCLPEPTRLPERPVIAFCWPGGGYSRGYYDLQIDGLPGYSQAEFLAERGVITVACDQLGVGDSDEPDRSKLTHENVAAADRATVDEILLRFARGEIADGYPVVENPLRIGVGHSYGGMLVIVQQGRMRTFHGLAVLGYSGIGIEPPTPLADGTSATGGRVPPLAEMTPRELMTFFFHWEDVPTEIVERDMAGEHPTRVPPLPMWASARRPGGRHWSPSPPAVVAHWANVIESPVFIGVGERDIVPDAYAEPGAYRRSSDITVFVTPRMAHMHNFAGTRRVLWNRLASWIDSVVSSKTEQPGGPV